MVIQLEDREGYPIAPIVMAHSVKMVTFSAHTLQEQAEYMNEDAVNNDKTETISQISAYTENAINSIIYAGITVSGNCREEIDELFNDLEQLEPHQ